MPVTRILRHKRLPLALATVWLISAMVWAWQYDRDEQLAQQLVGVWEDKLNSTYPIRVMELREDGELISAPLGPARPPWDRVERRRWAVQRLRLNFDVENPDSEPAEIVSVSADEFRFRNQGGSAIPYARVHDERTLKWFRERVSSASLEPTE
jgi:hypothetical protein